MSEMKYKFRVKIDKIIIGNFMKIKSFVISTLLISYYLLGSRAMASASCSYEEDLNKKTSSLTLRAATDEKVNLDFMTIGKGKLTGSLSIHGLSYNKDERTYNAMIERVSSEVSSLIRKGWLSYNKNKYTGFSFSNCDFNKKLLEDIGNLLRNYSISLTPSTHFYKCEFEKKRLRSVLTTTARFSKKSIFFSSTEEGKAIPNSKK